MTGRGRDGGAGDAGRARAGRRAALVIAGSGLFWIAALYLGERFGLSQRHRALLDLFALAGFALGLIMTYRVWRARRDHASDPSEKG